MEKNVKTSERIGKWEYVFEDEESKTIWRYDNRKNPNGPYQVDIQYKKPPIKNTVKRTKVKL
jgi:hypothetical protein